MPTTEHQCLVVVSKVKGGIDNPWIEGREEWSIWSCGHNLVYGLKILFRILFRRHMDHLGVWPECDTLPTNQDYCNMDLLV